MNKIQDIHDLITNQVQEGKNIDYKLTTCGNSDSDKKEFLADISSFANTDGGHIVIGLSENGGIPTNIAGIATTDPDSEILRMDSIIRSGLTPRIKYEIESIKHNSNYIFVITIKKSWNKPHRVTFKSHDKFYARNSAGKYSLDVDELKSVFTESISIDKKITDLIRNSRQDTRDDNYPISVDSKSYLSLHLFPVDNLMNKESIEIFKIKGDLSFSPIDRYGMNSLINYDGLLHYSINSEGKIFTFSQIHRNGIIKAINAHIVASSGFYVFESTEKKLVESLKNYIELYQKLNISSPIVGYLSYYGMKRTKIAVSQTQVSEELKNDNLYLPSFYINNTDDFNAGRILKPIFDIVWNAYGYEKTICLDDDGNLIA